MLWLLAALLLYLCTHTNDYTYRLNICTPAQLDDSCQCVHKQSSFGEPIVALCWASVADNGPTLIQHWFNTSCLRIGILRYD